MATMAKRQVLARIVVLSPPSGVAFALQVGKGDVARVFVSTGADLHLDFDFQVELLPGGSVRFAGAFVQGPRGGKFVYVNSGTLAGQANSCWTRRAKVSLEPLKWPVVKRAISEPRTLLEARIQGTARDGAPACATVPLLGGGWRPELL